MTMVEKVARALTAVEFQMPGAGGLKGTLRLGPAPARDMARAAIEAMREPTEAMLMAKIPDSVTDPQNLLDCFQADVVWRAMIDAALAEEKAPNERPSQPFRT